MHHALHVAVVYGIDELAKKARRVDLVQAAPAVDVLQHVAVARKLRDQTDAVGQVNHLDQLNLTEMSCCVLLLYDCAFEWIHL